MSDRSRTQVRTPPMWPVAVGRTTATIRPIPVPDRGEVRKDNSNAGLGLLGNSTPQLDDEQLARVLEGGLLRPISTMARQCNDPQTPLIEGRPRFHPWRAHESIP
ncbi:hypothetical protein GCM10017687_81020 [Streptomyces echinatus]|uniref:hypothetical protein n=1 Tax=Streptomyces echinatus TaxID=67293 RepID=UPI0031EDD372